MFFIIILSLLQVQLVKLFILGQITTETQKHKLLPNVAVYLAV